MRLMHMAVPLTAAALLSLGACGKSAPDTDGADTTATATGPAEIRIVKGEHGPDYPEAKLAVLAPAPDAVVTGDSVLVKVQLSGVELTAPTNGEQSKGIAYSKEGQHIHVIIDDKPYMAMYKLDSFSVGALTPGIHTLRAFPSRSWHESIKKPGAFVAYNFYVKEKSGTPSMDPAGPLLTYSRPKGDYSGADAKRVLLDFFLSNVELGPGKYKVVASVDGQVKDTLTEWIPYYIEGLADGSHTIRLELLGPDGKVVPGAYNTAEREIRINPAPTAAATPAAGHDSAAHAGMAGHDTGVKK